MKKKFFVLSLCLYTACILSGCSPLSRKPSSSDIKSFAKTHINDSVEPTGQKYSERNSYGKKYYYSMVDEHGVEFDVVVENPKVMLVEGYIPFLYNKNLS